MENACNNNQIEYINNTLNIIFWPSCGQTMCACAYWKKKEYAYQSKWVWTRFGMFAWKSKSYIYYQFERMRGSERVRNRCYYMAFCFEFCVGHLKQIAHSLCSSPVADPHSNPIQFVCKIIHLNENEDKRNTVTNTEIISSGRTTRYNWHAANEELNEWVRQAANDRIIG